jgi:hypothetical protein
MPYVFPKDREAFNAFQKEHGKPELDKNFWTHESHWHNFSVDRVRKSNLDEATKLMREADAILNDEPSPLAITEEQALAFAFGDVTKPQKLDDTSVFNLTYNYVMRGLALPPELLETQHVVPLGDGEQLELNGLYMERSGYTCTMISEYGSDRSERRVWGYQFRGSNGVSYKPSGRTTIDDSPSHNDIFAKVLTTQLEKDTS